MTAAAPTSEAGVWADLVGQERAVAQLRAAADPRPGASMTHAWLLTGPPGSGRSVAGRAFAAALQCPDSGCGSCPQCGTSLGGSHADVRVVRTQGLSIGVKLARELVRDAALAPAGGRWQVIIVEDADRLTDGAGNVLLRALEEPAERTVWILCAPSAEDVLVTVRSRCRQVRLVTPTVAAVAEVLVRRDGVAPAAARPAAAAAQGHVGRARRLATDPEARARRREVLELPSRLRDVGSCLAAAAALVEAVKADAKATTEALDATEREELTTSLGVGSGVRRPPGANAMLADLQSEQKKRATRRQRDFLDRALVDLVSFYRDVLAVQLGSTVALTNEDLAHAVADVARAGTAASTVRRISAVLACREAIDANAAPLLAVEAMTLALR